MRITTVRQEFPSNESHMIRVLDNTTTAQKKGQNEKETLVCMYVAVNYVPTPPINKH